jgi:hypothetical protein
MVAASLLLLLRAPSSFLRMLEAELRCCCGCGSAGADGDERGSMIDEVLEGRQS